MAERPKLSVDSLKEATRSRATFSGHNGSLGAAGERMASFDADNAEELRQPGQSIAVSPGPEGFEEILIGVAWDQGIADNTSLLGKMFKLKKKVDIDLDIGVLYELEDGSRGAIQAFGEKWGSFDEAPFMQLSGDEREGDEEGYDEFIRVNGAHWDKVKRVLVYLYIYGGAPNWAAINPKVMLDVPGEEDLVVTLSQHNDTLAVCAIGGLENVRGGIKLVNYTEFFPGHAEMDRAFGFGLDWGEGTKR